LYSLRNDVFNIAMGDVKWLALAVSALAMSFSPKCILDARMTISSELGLGWVLSSRNLIY
jgi:hypothetical protein